MRVGGEPPGGRVGACQLHCSRGMDLHFGGARLVHSGRRQALPVDTPGVRQKAGTAGCVPQ
eukprot:2878486-Lingulodinium_polyedra.AAC.1